MGCSTSSPPRPLWQAESPPAGAVPLKEAPTAQSNPVDAPGSRMYADDARPVAPSSMGPASTVCELFKLACARRPQMPALKIERPVPLPEVKEGEWQTWTYAQYQSEARAVAKGVLALDVVPHENVALQGSNQPEMFIGFMACMMARALPAGLYTSDTPENIAYKLRLVGARVVIVETTAQANAVSQLLDKLPRLRYIVVFDPSAVLPAERALGRPENFVELMTWAELIERGCETTSRELDQVCAAAAPTEACLVDFTSSTTGTPKAVVLSHDNIIFQAVTVMAQVPMLCEAERIVSYLPLSHIAGFLVDVIAPISIAALTEHGHGTVFCARSYDLRGGTLGDRIRCVCPTLFIGVPRVWEKLQSKIEDLMEQAPAIKRAVASWARSRALRTGQRQLLGCSGEVATGFSAADRLVLKKIRMAIGLDDCKYELSASAPIAQSTLEFFASLGVSIKQAYGATECTGVCTMETESAHLWGSVGYALPGCDVVVLDRDGEPVPACQVRLVWPPNLYTYLTRVHGWMGRT